MPSTRLTKYLKNRIVNRIISTSCDKEIEKALKALRKAGSKLMEAVIPPEIMTAAESQPQWFLICSTINITVLNIRDSISINCDKSFPDMRWNSIRTTIDPATHKELKTYIKLRDEHEALRKKSYELKDKLTTLLDQCTTSKKASEALPEFAETIASIAPLNTTSSAVAVVGGEELTKCLNNFPSCEPNKAKANTKGAGRAIREAKKQTTKNNNGVNK